ncbi:MAG: hypothetical protein E6387_04435 [Veillonella sp.]|nr:hypothetical protein [Veillonella sp.]
MSLGISQVSPILPLYFHEMGLSDTGSIAQWSGASMGITFLIVCLAAPFWGRLADRKGRVRNTAKPYRLGSRDYRIL